MASVTKEEQDSVTGSRDVPSTPCQTVTVTRIEYRLVNSTATDRQCSVGDDIHMWRRFEVSYHSDFGALSLHHLNSPIFEPQSRRFINSLYYFYFYFF